MGRSSKSRGRIYIIVRNKELTGCQGIVPQLGNRSTEKTGYRLPIYPERKISAPAKGSIRENAYPASVLDEKKWPAVCPVKQPQCAHRAIAKADAPKRWMNWNPTRSAPPRSIRCNNRVRISLLNAKSSEFKFSRTGSNWPGKFGGLTRRRRKF